jgi:hypothetical protein
MNGSSKRFFVLREPMDGVNRQQKLLNPTRSCIRVKNLCRVITLTIKRLSVKICRFAKKGGTTWMIPIPVLDLDQDRGFFITHNDNL